MHFIRKSFLSGLLCLTANLCQAQYINIPSNDTGNNLPEYILKEIISRQGQYKLGRPHENLDNPPFSKVLADFDAGDIDVVWTLSSREYEDKYQAIYYPLYRGLFGLRVGIVKKSEVNQFSSVRTLRDIQQFTAGQGKNWADTPILQANDLPVEPVLKYFNHFPMLEGDRFDYFPRGIHEPWGEVKRESQYNLTVDPHILLRYKAPFYFFVSRDNKKLRDYLNSGLELLVEDGTLARMFFEDSSVQQALAEGNVKNRTIIDLNNPYLTPKTPLDRTELWFDPLTDI